MKRKFSFELDIPEFEPTISFSREAVEVDYVISVILERARVAVHMCQLRLHRSDEEAPESKETLIAANRMYEESLKLIEQACRTLKVES